MEAQEFQRQVKRTMNGMLTQKMALANYAMGVCGEAGEVSELVKKHVFHGHDLSQDKLEKEIGDTLWYLAALCEERSMSLGRCMEAVVEKLKQRYPEGFSSQHSIARADVHVTSYEEK